MVLLRSAIYGTTAVLGPADRDDVTIASLVPTQLGRLLDREPPAVAARRDARRRARRPDAADARPRRRLAGRADLRAHAGLLGRDGRRGGGHRDLRAAARRAVGLDRARRRDRRRRPDGRGAPRNRRPRRARRARPPARPRPQGRHDRQRRRERDAERGRGRPARAPRGRRGGRLRPPGPEWGEAVTAHVVLRAPLDPAELRAFAAARLARFKVPKTIEPVDVPTPQRGGKLLRRELR